MWDNSVTSTLSKSEATEHIVCTTILGGDRNNNISLLSRVVTLPKFSLSVGLDWFFPKKPRFRIGSQFFDESGVDSMSIIVRLNIHNFNS